MSSSRLIVRKAAVLGAGVMGAQIAAHFANAGIPVLLYDLPAKEGDPNALVSKAIAGLAKQEPAPLGAKDRAAAIEACNYGADLARLAEVRPRDRGDRRAPRLEEGPVREDRAAPAARRGAGVEHVGAVAGGTVRGGAGAPAHALLRRALLQPAALHVPRGADRGAADGRGAARRAGDAADDDGRQGRDPREGHAELHRQPHRHLFRAGDDAPHADVRPVVRRRGRAHGSRDRPREERDVPDRGRRGARHDGARREDDARHAARRSVARPLRHAAGAGRAGRAGRARREDEGRLLPQGRQGHPGARPCRARLPDRGGRSGAGSGGTAQDQVARREVREAARQRASAGAVPVGDLPRPLPLQRVPARKHCGQRARRRPRDPLGLRLADGAVRDVAGRGLGRRGRVRRRGHRGRPCAGQACRCRRG